MEAEPPKRKRSWDQLVRVAFIALLSCAAAWLVSILWRNNLIGVLFPLTVGAWIGGGLGAADGRPIRGAIVGALGFLAAFGGLWAIVYFCVDIHIPPRG